MNKTKKIVLTLLFTFGLIQFQHKALSQTLELPEVISGEVLSGMKGSTVNRSTRQGATSSLTFGSSTTFGTSSSVNATSGTKSSAESLFKVDGQASSGCNSGGCITNSIGGSDSKVTAEISNIRASDMTSHNDNTLASSSNDFSDGSADITGISSTNKLTLDGDQTIFKAKSATVHSEADFDEIKSSTISDEAQTTSSSASGFTSSNTNVDINTSEYINTFQQAF